MTKRMSSRKRVLCLALMMTVATAALAAIIWSPQAPLPFGLAGLAVAAVGGPNPKIYAIGGYNISELSNVEVYDPTNDSWALVASMPTARGGLAAATAKGKVYAIGGCSGGASNPRICDFSGTSLNTVEAYRPTSNTWMAKAAMPTARADLAAVTGRDGKIYAIGGWSARNPNDPMALNTVEAYDPVTNTWATKAPMPTARYWVSAALGSDGKIYAIGGVDSSTNTVPAVEAYDPTTDTWATLAPLPGNGQRAEAAMGVAFLGGKVYAIGGTDIDYAPYATVEAYSLTTGTWRFQAAMPTPRGYLAAVASGGKVYAIGGYNTQPPYSGDLVQVEAF